MLMSFFCFFTQRSKIPRFKITGRLDATVCRITDPFTGELCVQSCDAVIKSIELQLVRVETCGCAEGYARDGKKPSSHYRMTMIMKLSFQLLKSKTFKLERGMCVGE